MVKMQISSENGFDMQWLKNDGKNKIIVGFEAIFNVFLGSHGPKIAPLEEALPE